MPKVKTNDEFETDKQGELRIDELDAVSGGTISLTHEETHSSSNGDGGTGGTTPTPTPGPRDAATGIAIGARAYRPM